MRKSFQLIVVSYGLKEQKVNRLLIILFLIASGQTGSLAADKLPGKIKLLPGYSMHREQAVDASAWTIEKGTGLTINYEAGPSEGSAADPGKQNIYSWYKEQMVNGYKVRVALIKPGQKTVFEPEGNQGQEPGNILLITFLLDSKKSGFAANFVAKVANSEEIADILLMGLTFDPRKGT
jgi:hypothetical protein